MNSLLIVVRKEIVQDLLALLCLLNPVLLTEIGKSPLEVIKGLFDLSFGLSLTFPRIRLSLCQDYRELF